jgi:3-deoxy-D-manno-octulosonate 8-phosphate phosphatase (KDO 8-P phosphatase)
VRCALLSGRRSPAVAARAAELGVEEVLQGVDDKRREYELLLARAGLEPAQAGFMGDELVDLPVLVRCGFACAPGEAPEAVRRRAHYVSAAPAGRGAAREVCEVLMQSQGTLERLLQEYLA